jgi:hypothetical protein
MSTQTGGVFIISDLGVSKHFSSKHCTLKKFMPAFTNLVVILLQAFGLIKRVTVLDNLAVLRLSYLIKV